MQTKKILTIDDLVKFCAKKKFYNFNASDSGYQLSVQVPSTFEIDDSYIDDTLLFCKVKLYHIGPNRNHSSVTEEAAEKSLNTIAYKPLLANFCEIDGIKDFTSHDIEFDEDGNPHYIERQIGCFTSDTPEIKYDEEEEKKFVYARVAIPKEYTDACDIIQRKNGTKVSVELLINEMNYSVEEKVLQLTDIIVSGATCLGTDPATKKEVEEGMKGARLDIESFSNNNNSIINSCDVDEKYQEKLIKTLDKINETLSSFNKDPIQRGGKCEMDIQNEEVVEEKDALEICEEKEEQVDEAIVETNESEAVVIEEESSEEIKEEESIDATENETEASEAADVKEVESVKTYSIDENGNATIKFSISHEDIRIGLYNLLSEVEFADNDYYEIVNVYDDCFVYRGWVSGRLYKQGYSVSDSDIDFSGDRVEVYEVFVTEEERNALDDMKKEYFSLKSFKEKYDSDMIKEKKNDIFSNEDYDEIRNTVEFAELINSADKYSVDEISTKCDLLYANSQKKKAHFAKAESDKKKTMRVSVSGSNETIEKPYGDLFE